MVDFRMKTSYDKEKMIVKRGDFLKAYKVNSVSEYINLLETLGMEKYVFRGQNEPYYGIRANGFRPYKGGWTTDKIFNIDTITKEFYHEVVSKISKEEKEHFLAFCQHYGIPTNLVDFSYSPLVALFFACYGKDEYHFTVSELLSSWTLEQIKTDKGTQEIIMRNLINRLEKPDISDFANVYLIEKKWLLDITDIIQELGTKNFFNSICDNKIVERNLIGKLNQQLSSNQFDLADVAVALGELIDCYRINEIDLYGELYPNEFIDEDNDIHTPFNIGKRLLEEDLTEETIGNVIEELYDHVLFELRKSEMKDWDLIVPDRTKEKAYCQASIIYVILLSNFINLYRDDFHSAMKFKLKLKFYFTYQPANLFDRLNMQRGLFIYQPYVYSLDQFFKINVLNLQEINPEICIEINNYREILSEIEYLGFNSGSVYGDFDNIAKSVVSAYKNKNNL